MVELHAVRDLSSPPLAALIAARRASDAPVLERAAQALDLTPPRLVTLHHLALLQRDRAVEVAAAAFLADPSSCHVTVRDVVDLAEVLGEPCPFDDLAALEAMGLLLVDRSDPARRPADRAVTLPEPLAALLTGAPAVEATLPGWAQLHRDPCGDAPVAGRLATAALALAGAEATPVALAGPAAQDLALAIAANASVPLVVVDAAAVPGRPDEAQAGLTALAAAAHIEGWLLCVSGADACPLPVAIWTPVLRAARGLVLLPVARAAALPAVLRSSLADVVSAPRLGGGAADRLGAALGLAAGAAHDATDRLAALSDEGAARVEAARATLDDLVLDAATRDALQEITDACAVHDRLLEQWGFRAIRPTGNGVGVLLDGPPGTGKTMAAHAIASATGRPLLRVDVPSVLSRWLGETEQRLAGVFERARELGAVLLFDEADSLFAKRSSEVRSSSDRYANLEVNTVLQLLERHDGIVVLTTNLTEALDPAVRRRLRYRVTFERPGQAERERLWERNLPWQAPLADDIDIETLAAGYELTGAHVANAALRAAARAAAQGQPISQTHLQDAARAECRALGMLCRDL